MNVRTAMVTLAAMVLAGSAASQSLQPPGQGGQQQPNRPQMGDQKLEVGSPAPELRVGEWVKGQPIEALKEGQPYVVEFWATWCVPCLQSIPHLTELAAKYPGVTFIGISDEEVDTVRPFVQRMGDRMGYTVAADMRRRTTRDWMNAAGQNGIPCAFIVDEQLRIAWIGHPMDEEFERVLALVAEGRYDPELSKAAQPLLAQVEHCVKVKEWRTAVAYLDQIIEMDPHLFNRVAIDKFRILLMEKGDTEAALAYANGDFIDSYEGDAITLRLMAREILTHGEWVARDPEAMKTLALDLATRAYRASTDARSLAALAMATFHHGNVQEAINYQRRAYLMADPDDKEEMKRQLEQYQAGAQARVR
jgi:thiol-disulfide isomerase/thioredoxin